LKFFTLGPDIGHASDIIFCPKLLCSALDRQTEKTKQNKKAELSQREMRDAPNIWVL